MNLLISGAVVIYWCMFPITPLCEMFQGDHYSSFGIHGTESPVDSVVFAGVISSYTPPLPPSPHYCLCHSNTQE